MRSIFKPWPWILLLLFAACAGPFHPLPLQEAAKLDPQQPLPKGIGLRLQGRLALRSPDWKGTANFTLFSGEKAALLTLSHPLGPALAEVWIDEKHTQVYLPREERSFQVGANPFFSLSLPPERLRQLLWGGGLERISGWEKKAQEARWGLLRIQYPASTKSPQKLQLELGPYHLTLLIRTKKVGRFNQLAPSKEMQKALKKP